MPTPAKLKTGINLKKSNPEFGDSHLLNVNLEYLQAVENIKEQLSVIALKHYNDSYRVGKKPIRGVGYIDGGEMLCLNALHNDEEHPGYYMIAISKEGDVDLISC
jgi:hypothetical protein